MTWTFTAPIIEWRGPAPYFYLPMDVEDSAELKHDARGLEYWGQVAVTVTINQVRFTTAVFPKDGRYLVPLKAAVRASVGIQMPDVVTATIAINYDRTSHHP